MKYLFTIISILFFCSFPTLSQNIKNKYTSRKIENGSVYFFYPQKGFESKTISSKLEYDITYLSVSDSVTYNFTYTCADASPVDSVSFSSKNLQTTYATEMLFTSPQKNNWKHRVSVKIPTKDIQELYNEETPYKLIIHSEKENYPFVMNDKKWKENRAVTNKIFEVIKYNHY